MIQLFASLFAGAPVVRAQYMLRDRGPSGPVAIPAEIFSRHVRYCEHSAGQSMIFLCTVEQFNWKYEKRASDQQKEIKP